MKTIVASTVILYLVLVTSTGIANPTQTNPNVDNSPQSMERRHAVKRYFEAANNHDFPILASMFAEDIVFQIGPHTLEGKQAALAPHEGDQVIRTSLVPTIIKTKGNRFKLRILERNDILRIAGINSILHSGGITFDDMGLIKRIEIFDSPEIPEMLKRLRPFNEWLSQNHPRIAANDHFGRREYTDRLMAAREWVVAGRPGLVQDPNLYDLHRRYLKASNEHDLLIIDEMTADEIVWKLGPHLLEGKRNALAPHVTDAALNTSLTAEHVRLVENSIECELVERNDLLDALDLKSMRHYPRYTFSNGLLVRKAPWRASDDYERVNRMTAPLRKWIRENKPDALAILVPGGQFSWGFEAARLRLRLARQWVEAGRPGYTPE